MRFLLRFSLVPALLCLQLSFAQVSVLTQHNDNSRTGQNTHETTLTTSNVKVAGFGKLFARTVDGYIYAQPLYVPNLTIAGGTHNVVYVATENNSVYAFDADNPNLTAPLWTVNLGTPVPSQDICTPPVYGCPYVDLVPQIGITATPAIDTGTNTIYVVAKTKNTSNNTYHFFLHALDLLTGGEKLGSPVEITAPQFAPLYENNRSGLLLDPVTNNIYIAFGSVGDYPTWYGFVMGYSASTLQQIAVKNVAPSAGRGGIWGGGQGLVGDGVDSVYAVTSNGSYDVNTGGNDYGDSVLKLSTSQGLNIVDWFTPDNQSYLGNNNVDLGSGGEVLIPGSSELVGGGKDGVLRVINTANMGKFNPTFNADVQEWQATTGIIMGAPVYWDSPVFGPAIYLWGPGDYLKAWTFNGTTFNTTPRTQSTIASVAGEANSVPLSISSNGTQAGTGIVWANAPYSGDANPQTVPGILRAFDASNLATELWDSKQNAARDDVGNYAKFNPPTIANGKVYLGTFSGQLLVYGLNPPNTSAITFVQRNATTPQSGITSQVPVSYLSPQTTGDLNVVIVGWSDTTSTVQSVVDTAGNTYSVAVPTTRGTKVSQAIYYAKNIVGGSNTVKVNFSQAPSYPDIRILEYNDVDPNSPLDVTSAASGTSNNSNSGSASTTNANDVIIGGNTVYTGTLGPGPAFTSRIITTPDGDIAEDRIVNVTGSYSASAPLTSSGSWVMQMAAFKQQSSSPNPAPTVTSVTPNSGPTAGGTAVTIAGTNFVSGATVTFGGTPATNVTVVSSTSITANTPAHAAGSVNVVVTNPDGQSGTLTNGYTYTSSSGSISFVQVAAATPQSAIQTVNVTYSAAQAAGDLNIVVVGWNDTTSSVSSVNDSAGNTYTLAVGPTTGVGLRQSIYFAPNIKGGSNTVKVTFSQAASYPDIRVLEYKGLNSTSPLDAVHGASGNSSTANSGPAATTSATELIFGADTVYTGNKAAGSGFTARIITTPDSDLAEDETVSSTGNYSATATLTASGNWVMQVATFKQ